MTLLPPPPPALRLLPPGTDVPLETALAMTALWFPPAPAREPMRLAPWTAAACPSDSEATIALLMMGVVLAVEESQALAERDLRKGSRLAPSRGGKFLGQGAAEWPRRPIP